MNWFRKGLGVGLAAFLAFTPISFARAAFHLFQIGEVYSNASGSVQFVEFFTDQSSQQFLNFTNFKSTANTFAFPAALPGDTPNKHFIIGTPGYAALPGVPAPDYTFPSNNFFNPNGDTLTLTGATFPSLTFTSGQLPLNNLNSLNRAYLGAFTAPPTTFTTTTNSPTNYAGTTSSVVKPGDANLDFHVNTGDIIPLMGALTHPDSYADTNSITTSQIAAVADVNQDGNVSGADLQKLLNNLKSGGGTHSAVPEPTSFVLAMAIGGLLWRSRKQFRIG